MDYEHLVTNVERIAVRCFVPNRPVLISINNNNDVDDYDSEEEIQLNNKTYIKTYPDDILKSSDVLLQKLSENEIWPFLVIKQDDRTNSEDIISVLPEGYIFYLPFHDSDTALENLSDQVEYLSPCPLWNPRDKFLVVM